MQDIIGILFVIIVLQTCIRLGFCKWKSLVIYVAAIGLINFLVYPYIVNQGNNYLEDLFNNKELINNLVLIVVAESIVYLSAGFQWITNDLNPASVSIKWPSRILKKYWTFPGISVLAATFYFQHLFLLWVSDISYDSAALFFIAALIAVFFVMIFGIKYSLKHNLLRLESSLLLISFQVILLLILLNLKNPGAKTVETPLPVLPLITFIGIALVLAIIGYFIQLIKTNKNN